MLGLKFIIEHQKKVKDDLKKRYKSDRIWLVDELIKDYDHFKKLKKDMDMLRHKRNNISKEINLAKKAGKDVSKIIKEVKNLPHKIKDAEEQISLLNKKINERLNKIPNISCANTPKGKDESQNKEIKKVGKPKKFTFKLKSHVNVMESLDIGDFDKSSEVTGKGFYYLKGKLGLLNQALVQYATSIMKKKKFFYMEPPLMINKRACEGIVNFEDFKDMLYKIENEDLYLIPSAEHTLISYFLDETLQEKELPVKVFGYSMCFRKEIGSHGIDTKGLYRTHQFNKVEQIIICKPDESSKYFNELLKTSEEVLKGLKLPYRLLEICSGDLGNKQHRQVDVEVWYPRRKEYGEVVSCSNTTDYQSNPLNIKFVNKKNERQLTHTLNNTVLATSRILVAILENCQNKDGSITIPAVLQKYTGFKKI